MNNSHFFSEIMECGLDSERPLVEQAISDAIIGSLPGVFYMFDQQGRLFRWNDEFARLVGITPDTASSYRMFDRVLDEDREKVRSNVASVFAQGQADFEARFSAPDGIRNFHLIARRLQIGSQPYIAGVGHDVTKHRQMELRLRKSEERFRTAFMTGAVAFVLVEEATGKFVEVNDYFLELYGFTRDEVIGHPSIGLGMWAKPEERARLLSDLMLHNHVQNFEFLSRRKNGEYFPVLYSVRRVDDEGVPLVLGAIQEITAIKEAEKKNFEYAKQLEQTVESTLHAISAMVEIRDPYTAGHERRVGQIASDIARQMGWSEERCRQLRLVGLVHDIGKIAVPAEILAKPTALSDIEFELVKTHAEKGYEILKDVKSEMPIGEIVRQHHEHMDGSGYPRGLKGEEILMEARILGVADVLESMSSHRPYRPALGKGAAIAELERGKGSKYDKKIVDTLLTMVKENSYKLML